jgi:hypothetical protein
MHEIDMGSPSLGQDPDDGATVLDFPGQGFGSLDFQGLGATSQEIGAVLDAVAEADAEEWAESLSDGELAELEAESAGSPPGMEPGSEFAAWMDARDDTEFANLRQEADILGRGDPFDYLRFAHQLDASLELASELEGTRQREDRAERARRSGPRSARPTDEACLAAAMRRLQAGSYLPGQAADMAGGWDGADPFAADSMFGTGPAASSQDVRDELFYQVLGDRTPPARARRQPGLPPVGRLAKRIGLVQ